MKGLELPFYSCSYICWLMPIHYSKVNFHLLMESFLDIPDDVIQKKHNKCLCTWHDGEYSCKGGRDLSMYMDKEKRSGREDKSEDIKEKR